jgi:hypothetical protein
MKPLPSLPGEPARIGTLGRTLRDQKLGPLVDTSEPRLKPSKPLLKKEKTKSRVWSMFSTKSKKGEMTCFSL